MTNHFFYGVLELYEIINDLEQTTNLVDGYASISDIPDNHPHKERIQLMENWFNAHKATTSPRTAEAYDYSIKNDEENGMRIISTNFTEYTGDAQRIDNGEAFGITDLESVTDAWINLHKIDQVDNLTNNLKEKTTVSISLKHPNNWGTGNAAFNNTPLRAGIDDYRATVPSTSATFSGLNETFPKGYKAIVYVGGYLKNTGASITDGNIKYFYQTPSAPVAPVDFIQTTSTTDNGEGSAPEAHYAVFGTNESPLISDSVTFTIDTLYGGGTFIGGVQIIGESISGEPIKTAIPIPISEPIIEIDSHLNLLTISKLNPSVSYEIQKSNDLIDGWSTIKTIESPENNESINEIFTESAAFYRIKYPLKATIMDLSK